VLDEYKIAYLHVIEPRIKGDDAEGGHEYNVSRTEFEELSRYFEAPTQAEGFNIVIHRES
jgi:hypothetical protein